MNFLISLCFLIAPIILAAPTATNRTDPIARFLATREPNFEWTAWGDSYATGVAAGNYIDGRRCLRYDQSYPKVIQDDPLNQFEGNGGGKFNFVACSGAKYDEIVDYQFYDIDQNFGQPNAQYYPRPSAGKPTIGTMTVGGDDIDFPGILNNCIIEGFPFPLNQGFTLRTCDEQRALSWSMIAEGNNYDEPNSDLMAKIDQAITKALDWGKAASGDNFKLYVVGYGQFFNADTTYCNDVTFARAAHPHDDGQPHTKLTQELRADFNRMSKTLNSAIRQVVLGHTESRVHFIDVDGILSDGGDAHGHRFCEEGIQEPDQQNANLYFFHYPYDDETAAHQPIIDFLNKVAEENKGKITWDPKTTLYADYLRDFWNSVPEEELLSALGAQSQEDTKVFDFWRDFVGYYARVFHPQIAFNHDIYEAVVDQYNHDIGVDFNDPQVTTSLNTPQITTSLLSSTILNPVPTVSLKA